MTKTQAIHDGEQRRVPYRLYQAKHPGKTYTEVKAERKKKRRQILRWVGYAVLLTTIAVGARSCIG